MKALHPRTRDCSRPADTNPGRPVAGIGWDGQSRFFSPLRRDGEQRPQSVLGCPLGKPHFRGRELPLFWGRLTRQSPAVGSELTGSGFWSETVALGFLGWGCCNQSPFAGLVLSHTHSISKCSSGWKCAGPGDTEAHVLGPLPGRRGVGDPRNQTSTNRCDQCGEGGAGGTVALFLEGEGVWERGSARAKAGGCVEKYFRGGHEDLGTTFHCDCGSYLGLVGDLEEG